MTATVWIYVAIIPGLGVKIGRSANIDSRERALRYDLRSASMRNLRIVYAREVNAYSCFVEGITHRLLRRWKIQGAGKECFACHAPLAVAALDRALELNKGWAQRQTLRKRMLARTKRATRLDGVA